MDVKQITVTKGP